MRRCIPALRKGLAIVPAVALMALAIALAAHTGLGLDVFVGFLSGVARRLGVALGGVLFWFNALTFGGFLLADRSLMGVGTVLMGLGLGPCVSGLTALLGGMLPAVLPLAARLALRVLATALTAAALAWYVQVEGGVQPLDMILLALARRLGRSYGTALYLWNALMLLGALLLGGHLGVGTLISLLCTGKLVDWLMPLLRPAARRCAGLGPPPAKGAHRG